MSGIYVKYRKHIRHILYRLPPTPHKGELPLQSNAGYVDSLLPASFNIVPSRILLSPPNFKVPYFCSRRAVVLCKLMTGILFTSQHWGTVISLTKGLRTKDAWKVKRLMLRASALQAYRGCCDYKQTNDCACVVKCTLILKLKQP